MYRSQFLFVMAILFPMLLNAQTTTWTGTVWDEEDAPALYTNVLLLEANDSTFIKGVITDIDGRFELQYNKAGNYLIQIAMIGYSPQYVSVVGNGGTVDLERIKLTTESTALSEVEVIAKKPLFEQKIDRTIVNVQNSAVNAGNSALAILSRSPSVIVDRGNNQINLMGNQGVIVMINNKPMRMETSELITMLDGMSADNIKNIELITSPPASYDIQGNAGIININLVRNQENGLTGNWSLNTGYGIQTKYGGSVNINYRKNKIYAFANLSSNNNNTIAIEEETQSFQLGSTTVTNEGLRERDYYVGLQSGEVGLDYDINKEHIVGASFAAQYRLWDMISNGVAKKTDDSGLEVILNENLEQNKLLRSLTNLNYRYTSEKNTQLSFDYDLIRFDRDNPTTYNAIKQKEGMADISNVSKSTSATPLVINVVALNYNKTLNENITWEGGLKWTTSQFNNALNFSNLENETFIVDPLFTDDFKMNEDIYAAYLSGDLALNQQLKFKLGGRYEHYQIDLTSAKEGTILLREKGRIYPNFFVNYKPSDNLEFNLSYVERIERPGFLILAPAYYFYNEFSLFTGNSNVIPSISKRTKFDIRYKTVNASLLFSRIEDPIFYQQREVQEDLGLLVNKPLQSQLRNSVALSLTVPFEFNKFWTSRLNFNANYWDQRPILEGIEFKSQTYNYNMVLTNSLSIFKGINVELNAQYYSKLKYAAADLQARWGVDFGLSKKFESGARISFNISDVFDTSSQWILDIKAPEANLRNLGQYDYEGQIFRLSYSMPFGNKNVKKRDKRNSGSQEEQNRLN